MKESECKVQELQQLLDKLHEQGPANFKDPVAAMLERGWTVN